MFPFQKRLEAISFEYTTLSSFFRKNLHFAFPISLHLVLTPNNGNMFALLSLFPYI